MRIPNNSHYHTIYSMFYNTFPDPDSFCSESSRRDSFYQRLFYEYQYTKSVGGFTFFYTLTYNDKSIPKLNGRNTFSYKDIRYVTNGRLIKTLVRHYGCKLRYFCACERGEGKGIRGIGNNPHYHFIFFVTPLNSDFSNFSPVVFDKLIKELWQGTSGYIRFQNAKFGCVKEGKFGNIVTSTEAFKYVSKYVTKDSNSKSDYQFFTKLFYDRILSEGISTLVFYRFYLYCKVFDVTMSHRDFFDFYKLSSFNKWKKSHPSLTTSQALNVWIRDFCSDYNKNTSCYVPNKYIELDKWFSDVYVPAALKEAISYYNTEYSDKPRFSKSLGIYGLQFIKDKEYDPHFVIPTSNNVYFVKPCLYYQRKLYYNPVQCPITGNVLYRLNDLGMTYKLNSIDRRIESTINNTIANIDYVVRNDIFVPFFKSDENNFDLDRFCTFLSGFNQPVEYYYKYKPFLSELCNSESFDRIIILYSFYNNVYRFRSYDRLDFIALNSELDISDVKRDYAFFLSHSYSELDSFGVSLCLCQRRDSISFSNFYLFSPYLSYFNFLDSLNDVVNNILSEQRKQTFRERADLNKIHAANSVSL